MWGCTGMPLFVSELGKHSPTFARVETGIDIKSNHGQWMLMVAIN